ncbi:hypothetical protein ACGF3K_29355 [Streptomyces sp. NPDC047980]|uniref:hypothetical protein n=1 Tax=unclassified Streptomyces TaxID=2593676 RepID=UPI0036CEAB45
MTVCQIGIDGAEAAQGKRVRGLGHGCRHSFAFRAAPQPAHVVPPGTYAYVANSASDTVSVIDTATNTVGDTVPAGTEPTGVAITVVAAPTPPAFTLLKTVGGTFVAGSQGTYTLTVTNNGDGSTDGTTSPSPTPCPPALRRSACRASAVPASSPPLPAHGPTSSPRRRLPAPHRQHRPQRAETGDRHRHRHGRRNHRHQHRHRDHHHRQEAEASTPAQRPPRPRQARQGGPRPAPPQSPPQPPATHHARRTPRRRPPALGPSAPRHPHTAQPHNHGPAPEASAAP